MKPEKRIRNQKNTAKPVDLPLDFLKLVDETITQALEPGLIELRKIHPESGFQSSGSVFGDELLLSISLTHGTQILHATTVHASVDYDPNRETPSINDLLAMCVDTAGIVFQHYLDPGFPERIARIAESSLGALEEAPFEWSAIPAPEAKGVVVHVKIDKSNPVLDRLAEEWLQKNDPARAKTGEAGAEARIEAAEDFLEERIEAIRAAKSGSGGIPGGNGPIRH